MKLRYFFDNRKKDLPREKKLEFADRYVNIFALGSFSLFSLLSLIVSSWLILLFLPAMLYFFLYLIIGLGVLVIIVVFINNYYTVPPHFIHAHNIRKACEIKDGSSDGLIDEDSGKIRKIIGKSWSNAGQFMKMSSGLGHDKRYMKELKLFSGRTVSRFLRYSDWNNYESARPKIMVFTDLMEASKFIEMMPLMSELSAEFNRDLRYSRMEKLQWKEIQIERLRNVSAWLSRNYSKLFDIGERIIKIIKGI